MPIPPPPPGPPAAPPGPPPPPIGGFKFSGGGGSSGGDPRSALLQSIQKGAKLKKTVTVDKSGPAIAGRVAGSNGNGGNSNSNSGRIIGGGNSGGSGNFPNGGMPKLAGVFEGLTSMPKLKPVSGKGSSTTPTNRSPPGEISTDNSTTTNGPMAALDFNAELTKHLTLKKQKKQQPQVNASEANLRTNRGPPPQPPSSIKQSTPAAVASDTVLARAGPPPIPPAPPQLGEVNHSSLYKKQLSTCSSAASSASITEYTKPASPVITPNKSSLFLSIATTAASSTITSSSTLSSDVSNNSLSSMTSSSSSIQSTISSSSLSARQVPNHGKPHCAPKPPGIQQMIAAKSTGNSGMSNGIRPTVSRHHSMKTPRSPPVSLPGSGPIYPTTQHFGTMRGPPQMFQSQESINSNGRPAQNQSIGRPTVAPPRPPTVKPQPPPTPTRSVSNTNINNLPLSLPPNSVNSSNNFSGSALNVSTLKKQHKHQISTGSVNDVSTMHNNSSNSINSLGSSSSNLSIANDRTLNGSGVIPPPLPPHRTCPAPPPPTTTRGNAPTAPNTVAAVPPVPPTRHSSMRSSVSSTATTTSLSSSSVSSVMNTATKVNQLVVDLEMKFSQRFHHVTEFRPPQPFTNPPKSYPSLNVKMANVAEIRKPQAPSPPVKQIQHQQVYPLQLNKETAFASSHTSQC